MADSFTWGGGPQIALVLCGLSAHLVHIFPRFVFIFGGIAFVLITGALFVVFGIPLINLQVVVFFCRRRRRCSYLAIRLIYCLVHIIHY